MTMLVELLLGLASLLLSIPIAMLFVECAAALWGAPRVNGNDMPSPKMAILIPAHDEALGIGAMLQTLLAEIEKDVRVVVIADNCTDATAEIARRAGVTVLERRDTKRMGKSYALAYGVESLRVNPPEVVLFMDADCIAAAGALDHLARVAYASRRPVQAVYLLDAPPHARPTQLLSAFAFRVKNLVRPVGLARLGLPCMLTGSGMALPWEILREIELASGKLAEDMWLTVELVAHNHLPLLDTKARVTGHMPTSVRGARAQRTRWEHGHLETIRHGAPRLLHAAWEQKRFAPLGMMLDLSVPPLSLLVAAWGGVWVVSLGAALLGFPRAPLAWSSINGVLLLCAIFAAWVKYARRALPLATLGAAPLYVLTKLPLYAAFLFRRQTVWERSDRDAGAPRAD